MSFKKKETVILCEKKKTRTKDERDFNIVAFLIGTGKKIFISLLKINLINTV